MIRVSIWRQFSSNHSSRFTVVGVFRSAVEAGKAAETLMTVRQATIDWVEAPENNELQKRADFGHIIEATPPEREFASEMGVSWEVSRYEDWFRSYSVGPVSTFDNLLFVDGTESSMGAKPVDEIVAKLGGKVYTGGSTSTTVVEHMMPGENVPQAFVEDNGPYAQLTVTVTCTALTEAVGAQIEQEYAEYLAHSQPEHRMSDPGASSRTPWVAYQGERSYSSVTGKLHRDGITLTFVDLIFFHMAEGFPAMIKYLRDRGCAEIQYGFVQTILHE